MAGKRFLSFIVLYQLLVAYEARLTCRKCRICSNLRVIAAHRGKRLHVRTMK